VRGYRSDLGLFAAWYDGHPLEKLTASDLAHFRQEFHATFRGSGSF
jgi:hypothetical protein